MKLSIRTRLSFSFALLFTALLILFSAVVYSLMSTNLERELKQNSEHDAVQVLNEFNVLSWKDALKEMAEESDEFQLLIQVIDEKGQVLYRTAGVQEWQWPVDGPLLQRAREKRIWSDASINETSHLVLTQTISPAAVGLHYIQIANSRKDINYIRNQLIYCINIGTPLILIAAVFAGLIFSKKALVPVERIRERAQTITTDNLQERLVYDGPPDELSRLTETLNGLLERIQTTVNQMKAFIADASHELRIPLTGLRGIVEVALRQDRSKEEYRQTLETVQHETERMTELVWDLLSLARADAGEMKLEKSEVSLPDFFNGLIEDGQLLNTDGKITLALEQAPDGTAHFDEIKIHQLLINLVENAIKYNQPGGSVVISAWKTASDLIVTVRDTGIGIAAEDLPKIFNRFYRVDKARAREAGGTGLGLSIARAIAAAHKGTLTASSTAGTGSEFRLTLPLS